MRYINIDALQLVHAVRERFWLATGYRQLCEVEPKLLSERESYLPVALPSSLERYRQTWDGSEKRILFVCPHIETNDYYRKIYQDFKKNFGDIPHVIIGRQDVPVDDPHVLGFVSDTEHIDLMQRSSLLYYHSQEPRHVHYPPIEAANIGLPIVFHRESLLARMLERLPSGAATTIGHARQLIEKILCNSRETIDSIRTDQDQIVDAFSESKCLDIWKKSFEESGISALMQKSNNVATDIGSVARAHAPVPLSMLRDPQSIVDRVSTPQDGIKFNNSNFPEFVEHVSGIDFAEEWGAWSHGGVVEISLSKAVIGDLTIDISGGAYGPNVGKKIEVEIGTNSNSFVFETTPFPPSLVSVSFHLTRPEKTIRIHVPHPVHLDSQMRRVIGIGLEKISIRTTPSFPPD
jgi:hypothetical protein